MIGYYLLTIHTHTLAPAHELAFIDTVYDASLAPTRNAEMKYGKEFQAILNDSAFPEDWKSSAIEYGQVRHITAKGMEGADGVAQETDQECGS